MYNDYSFINHDNYCLVLLQYDNKSNNTARRQPGAARISYGRFP